MIPRGHKFVIKSEFQLSCPYDLTTSFYLPSFLTENCAYYNYRKGDIVIETKVMNSFGIRYSEKVIEGVGLKECYKTINYNGLENLEVYLMLIHCKAQPLEILYAALSNRNAIDRHIMTITGDIHQLGNESINDNGICLHFSEVEIKFPEEDIESGRLNLSQENILQLQKKLLSLGIKDVLFKPLLKTNHP